MRRLLVVVSVLAWLVLAGGVTAHASPPAIGSSAPPRAASGSVDALLDHPGLAASDNAEFGTPPDSTGAIGPRHYLEAVNARLGLFDMHTLHPVAARDAYAFWGKPNTGVLVDPQVVWDRGARRWYYVALFTQAGDNELLLAWSRHGDPANLDRGWCRISIDTGKLFDDFPKLAYSRREILIGANVADLSERRVLFSRLWVIAKPAPGEACARPAISSHGSERSPLRQADGRPAFTLVPVDPVHPSDAGYVIAADCIDEGASESEPEARCGRPDREGREITVWKVTGSARSSHIRRIGGIHVAPYRLPTPAPQPGAQTTIETSDTRLTQAVSAPDPTRAAADAIWTQHTVAGPHGRSEVRWYELDPQHLAVLRSGTISDPDDWAFNAAIAPTSRGDAAIIDYDVAAADRLPSVRARSRGPHTPGHQMGDEVTLATSDAPDQCDLDPGEPCPWGDYAAATTDPTRPEAVWGSNQLLGPTTPSGPGGTHWRTQNFALQTR